LGVLVSNVLSHIVEVDVDICASLYSEKMKQNQLNSNSLIIKLIFLEGEAYGKFSYMYPLIRGRGQILLSALLRTL
jgi:hypothetical protein